MGQNTLQAMEIDVLNTFMPHTGIIPGPGGSENGCFGGKKQPKWQDAVLEEKFNLETW